MQSACILPGQETTGGGEEIRTPGQLAPSAVFKTAALDHSATPPAHHDLPGIAASGHGPPAEAVSAPLARGALAGAMAVDPVEMALSTALTAAAAAGRFDVVAQLARELEARRLTASATSANVVRIESAKRQR